MKITGIDTETYDPALKLAGPGWGRGEGYVVGISIYDGDAAKYFPIAHQDEPNWGREYLRYIKDLVENPEIIKVGANLIYDIGWLKALGMNAKGPLYDVQFAEALINPTKKTYTLDSIAKEYLNIGKHDEALYQWCADNFGGKPGREQAANIYRAPSSLVEPYAKEDARLPVEILYKQQHLLELYDLEEVFKLECALIPILVEMRYKGVKVDEFQAHKSKDDIEDYIELNKTVLKQITGKEVNVNASKQLAEVYDKMGIKYERTAKGNPSFTQPWLVQQEDLVSKTVVNIRKYTKLVDTFILGSILSKSINGRIHSSLHPLRAESHGTITGRFSSSLPNLQQIPSRDKVLAPMVRSIFKPEDGKEWLSMDFSQIEFRFFVHFSNDQELIRSMQKGAYFHDIVRKMLGENIPKKPVKSINFAMIFGASEAKITEMIHSMLDDVDITPKEFIRIYNEKFPAAKELMKKQSMRAMTNLEVRTILNRRIMFPWYTSKYDQNAKGLPYDTAIKAYGAIIPSEPYKALNYLLQGSAADLIKKGMVDCVDLFEKVGYPINQVHDELNFSYHPDFDKEFKEIQARMENAIKLKVPVTMGCKIGPDWGNLEEI